ncbi:MAG: T9SS type A sorting domain-containing protein [Saprospiraceae bacterium]|uniref:T9SS type A sorting domain-containing protein n=1 Tax=Candidatus Opimibacter skivensis TaxID=2982028 RepID=A0A9D7SZA9_9BACT|nr:T9SS type A sorting domain-containing protein [Candidatus Opimibacter skivensis]
MKKYFFTLLTLSTVMIMQSLHAQTDFKLQTPSYVGALSWDPSLDWTTGWTNFDPVNAAYADPTDLSTLNGMDASLPVRGEKELTSGTLTLDASKVYLLQGFFVVRSGAKLVIPAGTIIRAAADLSSSPKNYASIIVERGGKIEINGTSAKPVVFTSSKPAGQRQRGDWGGLLIGGKSQHNLLNGTDNNNVQMEGFNNVTFDANLARFGGTDINDNSGSITYLRIEFGGVAFETNKEINGLTLGAVGAGTVLNHVQVSYSGDDSFEWFGGTVNSSHLIAWKGTDDDFDTDNGYGGLSQYGIGVRDSSLYDLTFSLPSGGSTSEGFESDNEATGTANVKPYTNAVFSNYTMVGPVPEGSTYSGMNATTKAAFRRGARIRRNSSLRIVNSIFMGYRNFLMIDGDSTLRNTNYPDALALVTPSTPVNIKSKQVSYANNIIVNTAAAFHSTTDTVANGLVEVTRASGSAAKLQAVNDWVRETGPLANNIDPVSFTKRSLLINPVSASTSPNFRPVVSSPAVAGAIFNGNPTLSNFSLENTSYVGALSPDPAIDWTSGWTEFDPINATYPDPTDVTTLNGMDASLPVPGEKEIASGNTLTLDASQVYLLQGFIVVRSGGTLIIPAGTIIRAASDLSSSPKNYASIIVERGGTIEVNGTVDKPVIFTSSKSAGQRNRGDWGGLLIAGRSKHNLLNGTDNNNVQMEGFNNVTFDANLARFGGTDVNDNSGSINYLRIEFGGVAFETNKEINGLTLGAVGSGTKIDHVQVSYSGDDSFEWFGGTVNSKHLIAWKGTDDDFDTDNGYGGLAQFGIGVRDSAFYDLTYSLPSGGSTSEGFESDNEATGTASVSPKTNAVFSNFTMVGPVPVGSSYSSMNSTTKAAFRRGARIRRNSSLRIVNSIFMGYRNFLMIDGDSTLRNTNFAEALALVNPSTPVDITSKQISFANNIIVNTANAFTSTTDTTANGLVEVTRAANSISKLSAVNNWVRAGGLLHNNIDPVPFTDGTLLINPVAASKTPNFRPVVASPAISGSNFLENPVLMNLVTGTKEIEQAKVNPVYPNPIMNGDLHFGHEVVSYGIFDVNGKLVGHGFNTDSADINGLPSGIYFIKLEGVMQKFIVQ